VKGLAKDTGHIKSGMTDRADRVSAHFPNTQLLNLKTYGAPLAVGCRSKVDHPIRISEPVERRSWTWRGERLV